MIFWKIWIPYLSINIIEFHRCDTLFKISQNDDGNVSYMFNDGFRSSWTAVLYLNSLKSCLLCKYAILDIFICIALFESDIPCIRERDQITLLFTGIHRSWVSTTICYFYKLVPIIFVHCEGLWICLAHCVLLSHDSIKNRSIWSLYSTARLS